MRRRPPGRFSCRLVAVLARAGWLACQACRDQRVAEVPRAIASIAMRASAAASARDRAARPAGRACGRRAGAPRRGRPSRAARRRAFDGERLAAGVAQQRRVLVGAAGVGDAGDARRGAAQRPGSASRSAVTSAMAIAPPGRRRAPSRRPRAACPGTCTASTPTARRRSRRRGTGAPRRRRARSARGRAARLRGRVAAARSIARAPRSTPTTSQLSSRASRSAVAPLPQATSSTRCARRDAGELARAAA